MSRARPYAAALVVAGIALAAPARVFGAEVTFAKDIAPILQKNCQSCHRPGAAAPMSLMNFEDARAAAPKIKARVAAREMPPWDLADFVGVQSFKNDRSLSARDIEVITEWVDAGTPHGNPADMPPALTSPDNNGWHIGKPDHVVTQAQEQVMSAKSPDRSVDYLLESGLTEDRYFKAVEIRVTSGGSHIVSHAIAQSVAGESSRGGGAGASGGASVPKALADSFLAEYAPGKTGEIFPEGGGRLLKAASRIKLTVQYRAAGTEQRDRASIGFVFYPKGYVPKHRVEDIFLQQIEALDIGPGAMARSEIYYPVLKPMRLIGFQPEMRLRGKAMCLESIAPSGYRATINCVDRFDANWNLMYLYADDATPLIPAGHTLHIVGIHDNTAQNPRNPDPNLWVGWGKRSVDEMMGAHLTAEVLSDAEFKELEGARKARQRPTTQDR